MEISKIEMDALKKYESLRVSHEEAVEIAKKEIMDSVPDMGLSEFIKAGVNEAAAKIVIENMVQGAAKRIQLVAAFGVEAFVEAGKVVSQREDADIFNAIDLLEQELLKPYNDGI